jgi:hypothetical protein
MSPRKSTTTRKGGTKGRAEGKGRKAEESAEATAYAQRADDAALDHYHKTEGNPAARSLLAVNYDDTDPRALALPVRVPYWMRQEHTDEEAAEVVRGVEFEDKVELGPVKDLAENISAVLADPDTPTEIYEALAGAVTDITAKDKMTGRPEVIRVALRLHAESKEGGE